MSEDQVIIYYKQAGGSPAMPVAKTTRPSRHGRPQVSVISTATVAPAR